MIGFISYYLNYCMIAWIACMYDEAPHHDQSPATHHTQGNSYYVYTCSTITRVVTYHRW